MIIDGFWTLTAQVVEERSALTATGADIVVTSLRQAVEQVVKAAREAAQVDVQQVARPTAKTS